MSNQLGRYKILGELGQGGFAIVHLARDTELGRQVALKELRPILLDDKEWVDRFTHEAQTIASLNHPRIVTIYDVLETADRLFIVMRLVNGPSLDHHIARQGPLPWPQALKIIVAVAEALDYAHSHDILHRDLKPANILLDKERGPQLSDFGLAKLTRQASSSITAGGAIVGTPNYIAPEMWEGQGSSKQSDIYALGCILYEILTGEKLFRGDSLPVIMMAHFQPLHLPQKWPTDIPDSLTEFLMTALATRPLDRIATAGELIRKLQQLATGSPAGTVHLDSNEPIIRQVDWGEAPDITILYGRQDEMAALKHWLIDDRCRLIGVLGMGGIGKTALVTWLADQIKDEFDYVIWRSLRNAPLLAESLVDWILFLSDQQTYDIQDEPDKRISILLDLLRQKRCLLVLDNAETLLQAGERAGHYREGYEAYGQLFQRVAESRHQSCLLLTSREKPREFALLEGETAPVHTLHLSNIDTEAGQAILQDRGLTGPNESWVALLELYSGNPLALKLVAETIREVFYGDITAFLEEEAAIFGGVRDLLDNHFARLSTLDQELLIWLAIEREPIGPELLQHNIVRSVSRRELLESLRNLHRRFLLEQTNHGFTLQNVVMRFLTDYLVDGVCREIETFSGSLAVAPSGSRSENPAVPHSLLAFLLNRFALIKAQTKAYIRDGQTRLILKSVADRLMNVLGHDRLESRLQVILEALRQDYAHQPGYAGGNILNLLLHLESDLSQFDFSRLAIWQVYLGGMHAPDINFAQSDLSEIVFSDTFGGIDSIVYSPNGKLLAAGTADGQVRLWQARDGQPYLTGEDHTNTVWSVAFSPDNMILVSGSYDQTVRLWDVQSGQCLKALSGHTNAVLAVAFSPDGETMASGSLDQTVRLWTVHSDRCLKTLAAHTDAVRSVAFSPDGRTLASASYDQTVRLWDVKTGRSLKTLQGHFGAILSVCFSPNGKILATASYDRTIRLWDVQTGQGIKTLPGHVNEILSVAFSPDGRILASGSYDRTVRLWNVQTGQGLKILSGHTNMVWSVCFSPDGKTLASGSHDQSVRLWDVRTGKKLKILPGHINEVWTVTFSPDGEILASGSRDQKIRLWDVVNAEALAASAHALESGQEIKTMAGHTSMVRSVAFSPNGTILASGSRDRTVRLWAVHTGQSLSILQGHTSEVWSVCFSPNGATLASGSLDQTVRLWDVRSEQSLKTFRGHTGMVRSIAFSPNGDILASASLDQTVRLWDVSSGQGIRILAGHTNEVMSVTFSPDGTTLATGSPDQTVRLWNIQSGQELNILVGHANAVWSVAFSPNGETLASGSYDRTVRLWDVRSGRCIRTLSGHRGWISSVAFSPNGRILASCSSDGAIMLWDLQSWESLTTLWPDRPYERMNITGVTGLTEAQKSTLRALGAVEDE